LYCPAAKCPALCEDDSLYDDFDMDEVDLNLENYEELFGMALSHSEELFENGGIDSLFGTKEMSAGDSSCQDAIAAEVLNLPISFVCDNHGFFCYWGITCYVLYTLYDDVLVYSQLCICFLLHHVVILT